MPAPTEDRQIQIDPAELASADENSAAELLNGLFDDEPPAEPQDQAQPQAAPGTAEEETPPSGQDDADQTEAQPAPIEAPVSWKAEWKAAFAKLPPELQTATLQRESERDQGTQTALQKAAERERQLETERQQAVNDRAQLQQVAGAVLLQLQPEIAKYQNVDWVAYAEQNPAEAFKERQKFDALMQRAQQAHQLQAHLQQQQQTEDQSKRQANAGVEREKLIAKMPELADPLKAKAFVQEFATYLTVQGFPEQDIRSIIDHRIVLTVQKAMLWDKAQKARTEAAAKRVQPPASNVRQLRPGARAPNGATEDAQAARLTALHGNLAKSGSTRDAAALLAATGIFDD